MSRALPHRHLSAALTFPFDWGPPVLLVGLLVVPGLVDWSVTRLGFAHGRNWIRLATGGLAGLGLGLGGPAYLRHPRESGLWEIAGVVAGVWLLVEMSRLAFGPEDDAGGGL